MKKPVQYYSKEYAEKCKELTTDEIILFLENYRTLVAQKPEKSLLISLRIEPSLLNAFKAKAKMKGIPYQKQIKELMREWVTLNRSGRAGKRA